MKYFSLTKVRTPSPAMGNYWIRHQECSLDIPEDKRPSFNDLQDYAEAGLIKRGVARYLFGRNSDRTVKTHTYLGAPLVRKVIMGTYGRLFPKGAFSNYRTDDTKSRIEASTRFAVGGSVFNEAIHTGVAVWNAEIVADSLVEGRSFTLNAIAVGVNTALVSLQRYNRARMVQRVNEELSEGNSFHGSYNNWLGIDARAVENYRINILELEGITELGMESPDFEATISQPAGSNEAY